jgi:hypothetical protein
MALKGTKDGVLPRKGYQMVDIIAGRIMFATGLLILFGLFTFQAMQAYGADHQVIEIKKNLQMHEGDPIVFDYYINAGSGQGMRVGMVVKVSRRIPVYDRYQNKSQDDLVLEIAKLKIIHTENGISVARIFNVFDRENLPIVDYDTVMTGDIVDIHSATFEKEPTAKKAAQRVERKGASLPKRLPEKTVKEAQAEAKTEYILQETQVFTQ